MTEPSRVRPPADFWREVPCGHPPDPVAWSSSEGDYVCHCGSLLDPERGIAIPDAPGPVVQCGKCGCHVACPPTRDESSTEGGAWEGCVERDGIVVEPAQSEGAGEARVREAERLLRRAYADTHPEEVPLDVLRWLHPNDPAPAPDTPTEEEGT